MLQRQGDLGFLPGSTLPSWCPCENFVSSGLTCLIHEMGTDLMVVVQIRRSSASEAPSTALGGTAIAELRLALRGGFAVDKPGLFLPSSCSSVLRQTGRWWLQVLTDPSC